MGWRNDTYGTDGKPVEMIFEFDSVRNFSAIVLHTNNMFSKDVQVSQFELDSFMRSTGRQLEGVDENVNNEMALEEGFLIVTKQLPTDNKASFSK